MQQYLAYVGKKKLKMSWIFITAPPQGGSSRKRGGVSGEGGLCVKFGHGVLSSRERTIITNDPIRKKFPFATFSEKLEKY